MKGKMNTEVFVFILSIAFVFQAAPKGGETPAASLPPPYEQAKPTVPDQKKEATPPFAATSPFGKAAAAPAALTPFGLKQQNSTTFGSGIFNPSSNSFIQVGTFY